MEAESSAVLRLESDAAPRLVPSKVRHPGDHADLYAQRRYFLRAQFLVSGPRRPLRPADQAVALNFGQLFDRLRSKGCKVIALDLGRRHVVRAVIPGLVPISFGYGTEPLGLACLRGLPAANRRRACFPHPFP
jgi:ribosomal protein S12 methylthiotransferase accessory factor